jgi:hypothetical protein
VPPRLAAQQSKYSVFAPIPALDQLNRSLDRLLDQLSPARFPYAA